MENNYLEKNKSAAYNRYMKSVKKKYALNNIQHLKFSFEFHEDSSYEEQDRSRLKVEKLAALYCENKKKCSCYMCGNPRRFYKGRNGKTLKELCFFDKFHPDNKNNW